MGKQRSGIVKGRQSRTGNRALAKSRALNTAIGLEHLEDRLLLSGSPNLPFVTNLYSDLLGRQADAGGLANWVATADAGTPRSSIATTFAHSPEYVKDVVDGLYLKFLDRQPDAGGEANYIAQLTPPTASVEGIEAIFLGSNEYFNLAGGTNAAWVGQLYQAVLGRAASTAETNIWLGALNTNTRAQIATLFLNSPEYRTAQVQSLYQNLLHRSGGSNEISPWVFQGPDILSIETSILASNEYFNLSSALPTNASLAFSSPAQSLTTAAHSGPLSVVLLDRSGNPVDATTDQSLQLASNSGTGTFFDSNNNPITSITISAGTDVATFSYFDSVAGTPTLTVTASGLGSARQQEVVTGAQPTSLAITTSAKTLTTASASSTITVQLRDMDGNPLNAPANEVLTLSTTSSSGSFRDTTNSLVTSVTIPSGSSTASFVYVDTSAGTPTITVSAAGLIGASQQETVTVAAATSLGFLRPISTIVTETVSTAMQVQLLDQGGNAIKAGTGGLTVNLTSTSTTSTFLDLTGAAITTLTIPAGSTNASFKFEDSAAGTPTITASASGLISATQLITVTAPPPAKLSFTTAQLSLNAGVTSSVIQVALEDVNNVPAVAPTGGLVVNLHTSSANGTFADARGNALTTITIPAGSSIGSFDYVDTKSGSPVLTASTGNLIAAAQSEVVRAGTPTQVAFTTDAGTLTAGSFSDGITVRLEDQYGNRSATAFDQVLNLSTTSSTGHFAGDTDPGTTITVLGGSSDATFNYIDTKAGNVTISVAAPGFTKISQSETVIASVPTELDFVSNPQSLTAGVVSSLVQATLRDAFGNAALAGFGGRTFNLASTSGSSTFLSTTNKPIVRIVLPADQSTISFLYQDFVAGSPTITISTPGLTSAVQQESVAPAASTSTPSSLNILSTTTTLTTQAVSGVLTVQLLDQSGFPINAGPSGQVVSLSTTSSTGTFLNLSNFAVTTLTIPSGSSLVSFRYQDPTNGIPTLTAAASGLTSGNLQVTIVTPPAVQFGIITPPQTLTAGVSSTLLSVQLQDASGNPVVAGTGGQVVSLATSTTTGKFLNTSNQIITSITIPAGSNSASFKYLDTVAGSATLTASGGSLLNATQTETIVPGAPAQIVSPTFPSTITAGDGSEPIELELEDQFGNLVDPAAIFGQTVSLSSTSSNGVFMNEFGNTVTQLFLIGENTTTFTYEDTTAGTPTITISGAGLNPATIRENIVAAAPDHIAFTSAPTLQPAGTGLGSVTVSLEDQYDNVALAPAGGEVIKLSSTSTGATFLNANGQALPVARVLTIPAGVGTGTFTYVDSIAGSPTITADGGALGDDTQVETVYSPVAASAAFSGAAQTLQKSAAGTFSVEILDQHGNPVPAPSGGEVINLSSSSGTGVFHDPVTNAPVTSVTVPQGFYAANVNYKDTALGAATLTAASAGLASGTQTVTIVTGKVLFTSSAQTLTAGVASSTITVQLQSLSGTPIVASGGGVVLNLTTTSSSGHFLNGNSTITSVTVAAGASSATFTYTDSAAGAPTLSVASANYVTATQQEAVAPAAATRIVFVTASQTQTAATTATSAVITIELKDAFNNIATAGSGGVAVTLASTSSGGSFVDAFGDALQTPNTITFAQGTSQVSFRYADSVVGTPTITASSSGLTSATQSETVVAQIATSVAFVNPPVILNEGVSSELTLEIKDQFGNPMINASPRTINLATSSFEGTFIDPVTQTTVTSVTIPAGSTVASVDYQDFDPGTPTVTATSSGLTLATQLETVL